MKFLTRTPQPVQLDVSTVMQQVIYALLPGTLLMVWFFGWGLVTNLLLATGFAMLLEALMLKLRQRPLEPFLLDYSAFLTGWLLAVAMPAYSPWWLIAVACVFAIVIAKHLYGGLGYNPFNPAMVGYAAVLVSYPLQMTQWPVPEIASFAHLDAAQTLQRVFAGAPLMDGWSGATALDTAKLNVGLHKTLEAIHQSPVFGLLGGRGWEWVSVGWLVGGLWLLYQRTITWQIPVALLGSLALVASVFWASNPQVYGSPLFHLFSGASMLGAFFIATDPVTASTTPKGKLVYAAGIGVLVYTIRTWGGYPDAVAFAVLLMNTAVPLIDQYTQPRVYGTGRGA